MLAFTNAAMALAGSILASVSPPKGTVLRLHTGLRGLKLECDWEKAGDMKYAHNKQDVLVVDSNVAEELKGKLIDVEQAMDGTRLVAR